MSDLLFRVSGVHRKGEARPHSLGKGDHDDQVTPRTPTLALTLAPSLSLPLPLSLALTLTLTLTPSLTLALLLEEAFAGYEIDLEPNPIRVFKQNRVVPRGPHRFFGAVHDLRA